jgi:dipeptidyl aminopeptidase/acylaminoacyl peptidase
MSQPAIAPYGSWISPVSSDLIVSSDISLEHPVLMGEDVFWIEGRPSEGGREVIVRRTPDGSITDVTPPPFNVRTTVHEYGGRCFAIDGGDVIHRMVYFSNYADQRIYVQRIGDEPRPLTPEGAWRYADPLLDRVRNCLICVREDHTQGGVEAANTLVAIDLRDGGRQTVLVEGRDFYSNPRLSPDGSRLCWLSWNHPNMPWDGTELWVAPVEQDGSLGEAELVAGGDREAVFQPEWSPDGVLYFVSDPDGWWNLYRWLDGQVQALYPMEAEFGLPQWIFGMQTYGFDSAQRLVCAYTHQSRWYLGRLDLSTGEMTTLDLPYHDTRAFLDVSPGRAVFVGGSPIEPSVVILLDLDSGETQLLRRSSQVQLDPGYVSVPQVIEFPTGEGLTAGLSAFANYYPPANKDYRAPDGDLPPLLVLSHGGPTSASSTKFSLKTQFWTSRGFAVVDVNYGGSTGYGRAYRQRLNGNWGLVDMDDCANAARFLAGQGLVDPERLAIRGGSAGGYTTLCALTFRDTFKAGASHYGIGDLEPFVHDTHKFESRYLDSLVGPYPEQKDLYYQRSAINFTERISCPIILFQGLEDKVVPPSQSEKMFEAVRAKGIPTAYLPFEGEQHGFRQAENIKRSLDAELYFYSRIFGFELAEPVEPVHIENLD